VFVGRSREFSRLDGLLAGACRGRSGVLVLRGEAGIGKTKLLEAVVSSATDWQVLRTVGVGSEAEFAFAALHQLCRPSLDLLGELPGPQRDALGAAFGLTATAPPERFLVGLATLSLLSAAASERPVVCVVDDAQWLDRESAQTLAFVARRLLTDPIVMLFATRNDAGELAGLPDLVLSGLADEDADELLSSVVEGPLAPRVRSRVIEETRGNPLALLELPRGLTTADLAVGFGVPVEMPMSRRIEETFGRRIQQLPFDTRRLLVIAAADQVGQAATVWRAAAKLGIGADAVEAAEVAGLVNLDSLVRFRHPLVRSAVYRGASRQERQIAHRALADVSHPVIEPDRRAWHLAAATDEPDEGVADELERSAGRAHERGGLVAAATFLERSAELTPDLERRAVRRLLAAGAFLLSGMIDRARQTLELTAGQLADPVARAQAMRMEGALRFADGRGGDTPSQLFGAALTLREFDPRLASETMMEALEAAMWAAQLTTGTTMGDVAEAVRPWFEANAPDSTATFLLQGYSRRAIVGYPSPVEPWRQAVLAGADDVSGSTRLQLLGMLWNSTGDMLDYQSHISVARERVRQARQEGALATLPIALVCLAWSELLGGRIEAAEALNAEATEIAQATGVPEFPGAHGIVRLGILGWRGHERETRQLAKEVVAEAVERGQGLTVRIVDMVLATHELGFGRNEEAMRHALTVFEDDPWYVGSMSVVDLIEGACRSNHRDVAEAALARLSERAEASQTPWALGLLARSRALMAPDNEAEHSYLEALEALGRSGVMTAFGRAQLLYGEWLRGQRRRREAREQLHSARDTLLVTGAGAFARRAEAELIAAGERTGGRRDETRSELTSQELQVAQLAAEGQSNSEIAAQLYISPHTVSYHLGKVYDKLQVRSRNQLSRALASSQPG
jgi:DNA-binding CsgD family transcriptional regulator